MNHIRRGINEDLLSTIKAALFAGSEILKIYVLPIIQVEGKTVHSLLTEAYLAANSKIKSILAAN